MDGGVGKKNILDHTTNTHTQNPKSQKKEKKGGYKRRSFANLLEKICFKRVVCLSSAKMVFFVTTDIIVFSLPSASSTSWRERKKIMQALKKQWEKWTATKSFISIKQASEILPGLWIGTKDNSLDEAFLTHNNIKFMFNFSSTKRKPGDTPSSITMQNVAPKKFDEKETLAALNASITTLIKQYGDLKSQGGSLMIFSMTDEFDYVIACVAIYLIYTYGWTAKKSVLYILDRPQTELYIESVNSDKSNMKMVDKLAEKNPIYKKVLEYAEQMQLFILKDNEAKAKLANVNNLIDYKFRAAGSSPSSFSSASSASASASTSTSASPSGVAVVGHYAAPQFQQQQPQIQSQPQQIHPTQPQQITSNPPTLNGDISADYSDEKYQVYSPTDRDPHLYSDLQQQQQQQQPQQPFARPHVSTQPPASQPQQQPQTQRQSRFRSL